jgi:hypothetical protein
MLRNNIDFIKTKDYNLCEIFNSSLYNEIKEFTVLKTFFKEVKVIRPLCISKTKQIEISPEDALLQVKIENITSSINFIDKSLKLSKFLDTTCENDLLNNGMTLVIKDIQIIKEETSVEKVKNTEQTINNDSIPINNIHFTLQNDDFPIEIRPGEEVFIIVKVFKSAFIFEQIIKNKEAHKPEINKLQPQLAIPTIPIARRDSDSSKHTFTETMSRFSKIKSSDKELSQLMNLTQQTHLGQSGVFTKTIANNEGKELNHSL